MKKNKKTIYIIIAIVVILLIILIATKKDFFKEKLNLSETKNNLNDKSNVSNPVYNAVFPLTRGMKGDQVLALQKGLNRNYNTNLVEDGIFGPLTEKAIKDLNFAYPVTVLQFTTITAI